MTPKLEELTARERRFRDQVATMFHVPAPVRERWDARLAEADQRTPTGRRFGRLLGYGDANWLARAEAGLDECANQMTLCAQFGSREPRLEAQVLARIAELSGLMEQLKQTRGAA